MRIDKTGRGFARICETLGKDLQDFGRGFTRLWERIREDA